MIEEFDNLQRLIRLKRHEYPSDMDDFTATLLAKLHVRQREDYLKQSPLSVFWDQFNTWFESVSKPQLAMASVAALALMIASVNWFRGSSVGKSEFMTTNSSPHAKMQFASRFSLPPTDFTSPSFGMDLIPPEEGRKMFPLLLSKHFGGSPMELEREHASPEFLRNRINNLPFNVMPDVEFQFEEPAQPPH